MRDAPRIETMDLFIMEIGVCVQTEASSNSFSSLLCSMRFCRFIANVPKYVIHLVLYICVVSSLCVEQIYLQSDDGLHLTCSCNMTFVIMPKCVSKASGAVRWNGGYSSTLSLIHENKFT